MMQHKTNQTEQKCTVFACNMTHRAFTIQYWLWLDNLSSKASGRDLYNRNFRTEFLGNCSGLKKFCISFSVRCSIRPVVGVSWMIFWVSASYLGSGWERSSVCCGDWAPHWWIQEHELSFIIVSLCASRVHGNCDCVTLATVSMVQLQQWSLSCDNTATAIFVWDYIANGNWKMPNWCDIVAVCVSISTWLW